MKRLPPTVTSDLLDSLSPHIPDELLNSLFLSPRGSGRRGLLSAAQLFRIHLLALLTPVHSFNLLVALLPEQRSWRTFVRLRNRVRVPDVRMLHEFRQRLELTQIRRVNEHLLQPLLECTGAFAKTVALIDSADLPAATHETAGIVQRHQIARRLMHVQSECVEDFRHRKRRSCKAVS